MRSFLTIALMLFCAAAAATDRPRIPTPPAMNPTANATASAGSATAGGGDYSVIALPGSSATAAPLPAGFCQVGESHAQGFVWGLYWHSDSATKIDKECLRLLTELERLRATPAPTPTVHIMTAPIAQPAPAAQAVACIPPAKAKSVAAAKAAGACKS